MGSGEEAPDQLLAHPSNWRIHPKAQQQALAGILGQVGWVQQVLVNRRTGHVVDGHLRVALALKQSAPSVPVLYVDLDPDEETLVLASLDPLAAMAGTDDEKLQAPAGGHQRGFRRTGRDARGTRPARDEGWTQRPRRHPRATRRGDDPAG